jgi:hypothetical protein
MMEGNVQESFCIREMRSAEIASNFREHVQNVSSEDHSHVLFDVFSELEREKMTELERRLDQPFEL